MLTSVRRTPKRRLLVITALILSLVLHLIVGVPVVFDMSWQDIINTLREKISQQIHPETPDEVLARKKAKAVPKVSVSLGQKSNNEPTKRSEIITIRLIQDQPIALAQPPKEKARSEAPKATNVSKTKKVTTKGNHKGETKPDYDLYDKLIAAPETSPSGPVSLDDDDSEQTYDLQKNTLIDNTTVHVEPMVSPQPPANLGQAIAALTAAGAINTTATKTPSSSDAPPPFPVEIQANYKTSGYGFSLNMNSEWRMEGRRYSITDKASALGFKVRVTSDGAITEQGLQPNQFRVLLNSNVIRMVDFDHNAKIINYGKPSNLKQLPFNTKIQDVASIGFQMALAYGDKSQDMQLTLGTGIYNLHFELLDEELLKLPVGKVRTLHIHGINTSGSPVTVDVWLAPDYRNMPVKVKVTRGSEVIEQSLSSLAIEGTVIFGKKRQAEIDAAASEAETKAPAELPDAIKTTE
ncbi:DUF3108 domain-containing protein [Aquirhabdus parva]|uniref:DUF3108 domain-containing protein n=1 Tax=Aquirhabdus parva TaxID=2283318 RepID=A0A345P4M2_9GAMM|nr:DUF3108 domain-containing protein [Aquirhabdus parva]AXI02231.1 DUF3108 domain-containing protein [Aquirhabdus parva]